MSVSDTVITDGAVTQYEPIPVPEVTDLKVQRLVQIKQSIEAKLQTAIAEATRIRKMISTAKTDYKAVVGATSKDWGSYDPIQISNRRVCASC